MFNQIASFDVFNQNIESTSLYFFYKTQLRLGPGLTYQADRVS